MASNMKIEVDEIKSYNFDSGVNEALKEKLNC